MSENIYNKACFYLGVNSLARQINSLAQEAFKGCPVNAAYGHILLMLDVKDELCQKNISDGMKLKTSTLTRMMSKLENQGFVFKRSEGRKVYFTVTKEGDLLKSVVKENFEKLNKTLYSLLGEDIVKQSIDNVFVMVNNLYEKLDK